LKILFWLQVEGYCITEVVPFRRNLKSCLMEW